MKQLSIRSLRFLFWITMANYIAQIPYYLYNYYFPYHALPTASSIALLGLTLGWFLAGYFRFQKKYKHGNILLLSFLVIEALFYIHSFIFGAFFFQMLNPNPIIKMVFIIGYVSGAVAAYYAYRLTRSQMPGVYTGRMMTAPFMLLSALAGIATGFITIHSPLTSSWLSIFLWIAVGLVVLYFSPNRKAAVYGGTAFGFFTIASWLISGFQGTTDKIGSFLVLTLVLSAVGAACGLVGAYLFSKFFRK